MAALAIQQVVITGLTPSLTAAAGGGDTVAVTDDRCFLVARNASGSPITVTVVVPGVFAGQSLTDIPVSVPATTGEKWIPLPKALADLTTGLINITYSGVTSLTVGAFRV